MELLAQIWPKVQTLDMCQPGPDFNWQRRLDEEKAANQAKFSGDQSLGSEPGKDADANSRELDYAVNIFRDWVNTELKYNLPSSPSFMSAIDDLPDLSQQVIQVERRLDERQDALLQLKLIQKRLAALPSEPAAGSEDEETLLSLWIEHKALAGRISNDITLGEARSERDTAHAKRENLDQMITKCGEERAAKGWEAPGGADKKLSSAGATEQEYFCDWPIVGGFSHKNFVNPSATPAYPQIPLVNAQNVENGGSSVDVALSCGTIFNASVLDYKGDLPSF
jgi:hypothetical protein